MLLCLTPSIMFGRQYYQTVAHCLQQSLVKLHIDIRYFSRWTWRHLCLWCWHRLLPPPTCWSSRLQWATTSFVLRQWERARLCPSSTMQTTNDLWPGWELQKVHGEWKRIFDTDHTSWHSFQHLASWWDNSTLAYKCNVPKSIRLGNCHIVLHGVRP